MIVLITGGARSGKSSFAERYARQLGDEGYYMATAEALDTEMQERIDIHRRRREEETDFYWRATYETPLDLCDRLERIRVESRSDRSKRRVIVLDCLTLWLSNLLLANERRSDNELLGEMERLAEQLQCMIQPVLLVSNEVGNGIVPEYPLGRRYRDLAGRMNQRIAEISQEVFLVTCGIPVELKRLAFQLEPRTRG